MELAKQATRTESRDWQQIETEIHKGRREKGNRYCFRTDSRYFAPGVSPLWFMIVILDKVEIHSVFEYCHHVYSGVSPNSHPLLAKFNAGSD